MYFEYKWNNFYNRTNEYSNQKKFVTNPKRNVIFSHNTKWYSLVLSTRKKSCQVLKKIIKTRASQRKRHFCGDSKLQSIGKQIPNKLLLSLFLSLLFLSFRITLVFSWNCFIITLNSLPFENHDSFFHLFRFNVRYKVVKGIEDRLICTVSTSLNRRLSSMLTNNCRHR